MANQNTLVENPDMLKLLIWFCYCSYDCQHFGVREPEFAMADDLRQDISHHESMWQLYEEFSNGLEELTKEDWISFRSVFKVMH